MPDRLVFAERARLAPPLAAALARCVTSILGHDRDRPALAEVVARCAKSGEDAVLEGALCLDACVELALASDGERRRGHVVEAFALHGVESALLDALIGDESSSPDQERGVPPR